MNDSSKTGIFYMISDIVFFMAMIAAMVWATKFLIGFDYKMSDRMQEKTTIAQNDSLTSPEYTGYSAYGQEMYDGDVSGVDVVSDIRLMKNSDDVNVYIGGICLNTTIYSGTKTYMQYIKEDDSSPLLALVNTSKTYTRQYTYDSSGNIKSVTYKTK